MKNKSLVSERHQINLWQGVLMFFVICLVSVGFAVGQAKDERKLELVVQTGHTDSIDSIAFSSDGKRLVSASEDNTIKLWDVETSKEVLTLPIGELWSVAFSSDNKTIATGSENHTIKIWDIENKKEIRTLIGHDKDVKSLAFSSNGKILASGSYGNNLKVVIKLWDIDSGKEIRTIEAHDDFIEQVVFSSDDKFLVSQSSDKYGRNSTIKMWEILSGKEIRTLTTESIGIAFSPDGKTIATLNSNYEDFTIKLINFDNGKVIRTFIGHTDLVQSIEFSPDGKVLATGSNDRTVKIWDVNTGKELHNLTEESAYALAFSSDGKRLATGNSGGEIKLWDIESGKKLQNFEGHSAQINSIVFSPDVNTLIAGSNDGGIKIWNTKTETELRNFKFEADRVLSVAFSPDGKKIAGGSFFGFIKTWDFESGKELNTFQSPNISPNIYSIAFSSDGRVLASGGNEIKLWDVESGKELKTFMKPPGIVFSLAFSSDNKMLASGNGNGINGIIEILDIESGKVLQTLKGHGAFSLAFSSDNKILVSDDLYLKTIKFWDVSTGQELKSLPRNEAITKAEVMKIAPSLFQNNQKVTVSKDGVWQANQAGNGKINLFEASSGKFIASLIALDKNDWAVIAPDGRFDASEGALKLMHYAYGLEVIDLEQLKEAYYEPGLLQKLLGYSKEPLRPIVPLKDVKLYPEIVEQKFDGKTGKLNIKLKNRGGGIGKTEVFVNGKRVIEDARDEKLRQNPNIAADQIVSLTVDLSASNFVKGKENQIKVITSNYLKEIGKGNIQSRGSEVVYLDQGQAELALPNFYAIVGGVSDYTGEGT